MKTILMIGDSWGVPNYYGKPGVDEKFHTEFILKNKGYDVHNCSQNGSGNISSLEKAKQYLNGDIVSHPGKQNECVQLTKIPLKVDFIVWFHTEFFRDDKINKQLGLEENLSFSANRQYKLISDFSKNLNSKLIVIGGQSPIRKEIYNFCNPFFIIPDWRSLIVKQQLPACYTTSRVTWIEEFNEPIDVKLKLLEIHNVVLSAMTNSEHFPDGGHPGIEPHAWLSNTLDNIFINN